MESGFNLHGSKMSTDFKAVCLTVAELKEAPGKYRAVRHGSIIASADDLFELDEIVKEKNPDLSIGDYTVC